MIKAIETEYKGYRFRSRLEARWAVFFDTLSIAWEYEKEGYDLGEAGWYLPDFWLPLSRPWLPPGSGYFIEIKGKHPTTDEILKIQTLAKESNHSTWLYFGEPGKQRMYGAHRDGTLQYVDPPSTEYPHWLRMKPEDTYVVSLLGQFSRWSTDESPIYENHICNAIAAARSARFEHGENGTR